MFPTRAAAQVPGLVAGYAFNEVSGTTTLDASGNGNVGTLTSGTLFSAGKNGNAVSLDGVNDFVNLGNGASLQLTGSVTISAWINAASFPADDAVVVSKRGNGPLGFQLDTTVDRGPRTVGFKLTGTAGGNMFRYGTTTLQINTWYHVAGVYDATAQTLSVYVNGQLENGALVGAATGGQQNSSQSVHVGQRPGLPGTNNFGGRIDDVRIYARALGQVEIEADMATPVGGTPVPNTPPTITAIGDQVTAEDTVTAAIGFTVGDAETPPGSLTLSASSSNAGLVPGGNVVFGGSGANRTLTVAPAANQNGVATITVTVSDGQATASTSFQLTVTAVNDGPTITGIGSQVSAVGAAVGPLSFTVGDPETAAGSLTVSGSSSNQTLVPNGNIVFGGGGANRTVTVTPAPGQTGTTTITLTVSDGSLATSTGFQLTVTAIPTGLLAAYAFNEASGTATADGSGNGNTGTLSGGAVFAGGKNGNAVSLDGVDDFVNLGTGAALQLTGSVTISGWINATSFPADDAVVVSKRSNTPLGMQLDTTVDRGPRTVAFKLTTPTGGNMFRYGTTTLQPNTWYHVAGVYNAAGQTLSVYVNGQLENGALVGTVAAAQQNSGLAVHVGQRPGVPGTFNFRGRIDDVRIYGRALSQAEIQADMGAPVGGTPVPNTPPTITAIGDQVTAEDTPTAAIGFTVGDAETAPGSLTVSGSSSNLAVVPTANLVFGGSGANRTLTATPAANQNGTATITVTVSDGLASVSTSFQLTVAAVNDAPTITAINNQTAPVGTAVGPLSFTVSDVETAAGSLTVSGSSSNQTLVPGGSIAFGGSGANRTVTVTPAASQTGTATITVTVSDGQLTTSTAFQLTVTSGNTPPTITVIAPQTTGVGTPVGPLSFTVGDAQTAAGNLTMSGSSSNQTLVPNGNIAFGGSGANRTVTVTPAGSQVGVATITVAVSDGQLTASSPFQLTVAAAPIGLVAAYAFNEPSGTTTADGSGNGNTGILTNGALFEAGKNGNAVSLDGVNDFVNLGNGASLQLTGSTTISGWINSAGFPADDAVIVSKRGGTPLGIQLDTTVDRGPRTVGFKLTTSTGGNMFRYGTTVLQLNTWYHVAGVYDAAAQTLSVYVNGQLDNGVLVGTVTATQQNSGQNMHVGQRPGAPGTYNFRGRIDDVRIYGRALTPSEIQADMATGVTPGTSDTIAPSVAITAPAVGATAFGLVSVVADASDNIGIAGVQFQLDGQLLGEEVASSPYFVMWNAAASPQGTHVLTAVARDFAGNTKTSAPVTVTVVPTTPALVGQWSAPVNWPLVAVHAVLMRNGRVLVWDGEGSGLGSQRVWDPATGAFTSVPAPDNLFCSSFLALADGRILTVGGHLVVDHVGIPDANFFDPGTSTWSSAAPMSIGRWYPTATTLADGRILALAGQVDCRTCIAPIPEVFNPLTNQWTELPNASLVLPYYPHMFVLPDGRVLNTSASQAPVPTRVLDVATQTWTVVDPDLTDGIATMYRINKFMKSGSSFDPNDGAVPSANTTYVLDMTQPQPAWREVAPMAFPRTYHTHTLLPDGNVLVTGGGSTTAATDSSVGVLAAEMWSPATESWTTMASGQVSRLYHSVALLLPDARVLVAGGGRVVDGSDPSIKLNAEIYSPPYLFKGARPTITTAPGDVAYNSTFSVQTPSAAQIASVALIRLGSVTHAFNNEQRFLNLPFQPIGGSLSIQAPAGPTLAPAGYYMLFLVNTNGVPSVGAIMRLH
jgi:hypothetical protein